MGERQGDGPGFVPRLSEWLDERMSSQPTHLGSFQKTQRRQVVGLPPELTATEIANR